jgi:hypothetical protein
LILPFETSGRERLDLFTKELITMRPSVVPHSPPPLGAGMFRRTPAEDFRRTFAPLWQGDYVRINAVRAIGATIQLTPEQFQFARAFWMAIPFVSHDLPLRNKAVLAKDLQGTAVLAFSTTRARCARPSTRPIVWNTLSIKSGAARQEAW